MLQIFELGRIFIFTFILNLVSPVFWLVVFLVFLQYRRVAGMERRLFGRPVNNVATQVLASLGLGLLGGFLASILMVFMGLSLEQIGLYFIWPVALLLLLIHPRFLCFAYAGGIVAVNVMLFRFVVRFYPALADYRVVDSLLKIHIPALLVLIGLLHLMEAMLIYIGGHWGSSPLYYKRPGGEVVGGFSLQRFWPLPLVALLVTIVLQTDSAGVSMPQWWPVIKSTIQPDLGQTLQYMAIPVAAGLGYGDLALSSTPREKSIVSARYLALYSAVLLGMAVTAEFYPLVTLPAVLLAPLGHELLIVYGNRREFSREPRYLSTPGRVRLMVVLPDTAAARAGLGEGDIILKVNGTPVQNQQELIQKIEDSYFMVLLEGTRGGADFSTVLKKGGSGAQTARSTFNPETTPAAPGASFLHRGAGLGLIMAPSSRSSVYVETKSTSTVMGWLRRLTGRN